MRTHDVKCWPEFFNAIVKGDKSFEVRKADRAYKVGDRLNLQEWQRRGKKGDGYYTGNELLCQIDYIAESYNIPGIAPGYVVMAVKPLHLTAET